MPIQSKDPLPGLAILAGCSIYGHVNWREKIELLRLEAKWSVAELGRRIGESGENIRRYLRNEKTPPLDTAMKLAIVFGHRLDTIFGGSAEPAHVQGDPALMERLLLVTSFDELERIMFENIENIRRKDRKTAERLYEEDKDDKSE